VNHWSRCATALFAWLAPLVVAAANFVGSANCISCHADQAEAWRGSHHAQAMQVADPHTVLGNFSGTSPHGLDGVQRFFRRGAGYFADIQVAGKAPQEFPIRYTFGVYPLQQYLVEQDGGRLQALTVAWDARPATQGGQRWFSLHPQGVAAGDPLHWTGRDSNWNFMCAACHSTNLRKNYSLKSDRYRTTWSDLDVACEACHGPASEHLQWARSGPRSDPSKGLSVTLHASQTVPWGFASASQRIASPRGALADARTEAQICFPCHARRQALSDGGTVGHTLLDDYLPQLIEPGVYRADGQIDAEDFEFGSFVQSKMFGQGVTCTNCHDAHSLKLRAAGNAVCTQCHRAAVFDQPAHSHQPPGTVAGQCVSCHMPAKTYMGVDLRRDHSFRVPRPEPPYAAAIDDAWSGAPATQALLRVLVTAPPYSAMVRASVVGLLATQDGSTPQVRSALVAATRDPDALVRLGAARGIAALPAADALQVGAPLLRDPARAVRIEAARSLAGTADDSTAPAVAVQLTSALAELVASEGVAAERPESHVNLAQIYSRLGQDQQAVVELTTALKLDSRFVPAMVNLADLYRAQNRDTDAEQWLRRAVSVAPTAAAPAHALGLLEIRQGHVDAALDWLRKAVELDGSTAHYSYVYAVALSELGRAREARDAIAAARRHAPKDESLQQLQRQLETKR
jgi:predicted CXXCH cytochrome family protein